MAKSLILSLFTILVVSLASCSSGGGGDDGDSPFSLDACSVATSRQFTSLVINGDQCSNSRSAVVALRIENILGFDQLCSGTVVSGRSVLTAAHCLTGFVTRVFVETGFGSIEASSFELHPNFREDPITGVLFSDVAIVTADLPEEIRSFPVLLSRSVAAGEEVVVAGFGLDEDGGSGRFKAGNMLVADVDGGLILAEFNGEGSNTCQGDSGGPLFASVAGQFALAGVTSAGLNEDCGDGDLSLFTDLSAGPILDFIFDKVSSASGV